MNDPYFEDFEIGDTVTTNGRTITDADQANYAGLSGNFDPIHLNEERMADSQFGERLVYGYLVLNVLEGLKVQTGIVENVVAFYGIDEARFVAPVLIGDTIHGELTVLDLEEQDEDSGILVLEEKAINQDGEEVLVATTRTLIEKRD